MECLRRVYILQLVLQLTSLLSAASDYFCETFYTDITARDPLRFSIGDNAPKGTILKAFDRHPHEKNTVIFTTGDLEYLDFDRSAFALVTKNSLHSKAERTLRIFGNCTEHIERINYGITLPLTVLLDVHDINDPPVFGNLEAFLRIKESVRVGSLLYKVEMKQGFDVKTDFATTQLRITNVTAEGHPHVKAAKFFSIDLNGNIFLRQPVDYETDPRKFELAIHAEDLGEPPLTADSTLTFYIQDTDDMTPKFTHQAHHASVIGERPVEAAECGPTKPEIFAEDQDVTAKSEVHYEISAGPPGNEWQNLFKLEETSGRLCQLTTIGRTVPDPLTGRLTFANYTFKIKGYQVDNRRKYATADLFVHVLDSNQHTPSFDRKLYRATVAEYPEVKAGQQVIQVKAEDKDHGENSVFRYELEGPGSRWFSMNPDTGWITVLEPERLDREIYNSFEFKVKATETSTLELLGSEARVVITLEDLNDHTPQFDKYRYSFTVRDNLKPGSPIHTAGAALSAADRDSGDNGLVRYSVSSISRESGEVTFNDFGRFTIDADDGTLSLTGSLSDLRRRRTHPVYRLRVTATDQARRKERRKSSSVDVVIRIHEANDFIPIVTPKRGALMVNETEPMGTPVYQIEVHDRDGDEDIYLQYRIKSGNAGNTFRIASMGRVLINKPLDRETTEFYKLRIEVSDGKHKKTTSLKIQVLDANDNTPTFTQEEYVFTLPEDPPPGFVVGRVTATDPDAGTSGTVHYSVRSGPGEEVIHVHSDGRVAVRQRSSLWDRETNDQIRLRLVASDGGQPRRQSSADLLIRLEDVNDNSPTFTTTDYRGWVDEDDAAPKPQFVTMDIPINATDADADFANRDVRYRLTGEGSDVFYMDPVRADVITARIGQLDAERRQTYELTITATDQTGKGLSSSARLTITVRDQNDNAPTFTGSRHFTVLSDSRPGQKVGTLSVQDRDVTEPNNHVIHILKKGGRGKFAVDFENGDITLVDDLNNGDILPVYELVVQALDGGVPRLTNQSTVTIRVPVNRPPVIWANKTRLLVDEGLPPGALVGAMAADDLDEGENNEISGNMEFFIMDNSVPFEVSPHGLIRTKHSLDREKQQSYEFEMYVKDEGYPPMTSSALIQVIIDDVNDHAPEFVNGPYEGTVVEDDQNPNPQQRVKLNANFSVVDRDATAVPADIRFSLHGDDSTLFTIDPLTAEIKVSTLGYGVIDREKTERYNLKVRATDHAGRGLSSEADLVIRVLDVNDVTPRFRSPGRTLEVSRHVAVGQVIGNLAADDGDATQPNNLVIYTLENDPFGKFSVDSHTGEVRALSGVFYPPRQVSYKLRVAATDMGFPPRRAEISTEILVNKTDFNDHKPEFYGETIFYVNEEVPVGTLVGTVSVRDEDGANGHDTPVRLAIHADNPVPFRVDSDTGEIRSTALLDFDNGARSFTFTVAAHDLGRPPLTSQVSVGVILDDINDNPPRFTQPVYQHKVHTMFPAGTLVATPFAYDTVDVSNSVYRYELLGPDVGTYFYIEEHTGAVRTTARLEDINQSTVEYKVVAQDVLNSRLSAEALLVIDIYRQSKTPCCCKVPCDSPKPP